MTETLLNNVNAWIERTRIELAAAEVAQKGYLAALGRLEHPTSISSEKLQTIGESLKSFGPTYYSNVSLAANEASPWKIKVASVLSESPPMSVPEISRKLTNRGIQVSSKAQVATVYKTLMRSPDVFEKVGSTRWRMKIGALQKLLDV